MRFDPLAPPFWEQGRGGPVTQIMREHRLARARAELRELEAEASLIVYCTSQKERDQLAELRLKIKELQVLTGVRDKPELAPQPERQPSRSGRAKSYRELRAAGLCTSCRSRPAAGAARCAVCSARMASRRAYRGGE